MSSRTWTAARAEQWSQVSGRSLCSGESGGARAIGRSAEEEEERRGRGTDQPRRGFRGQRRVQSSRQLLGREGRVQSSAWSTKSGLTAGGSERGGAGRRVVRTRPGAPPALSRYPSPAQPHSGNTDHSSPCPDPLALELAATSLSPRLRLPPPPRPFTLDHLSRTPWCALPLPPSTPSEHADNSSTPRADRRTPARAPPGHLGLPQGRLDHGRPRQAVPRHPVLRPLPRLVCVPCFSALLPPRPRSNGHPRSPGPFPPRVLPAVSPSAPSLTL